MQILNAVRAHDDHLAGLNPGPDLTEVHRVPLSNIGLSDDAPTPIAGVGMILGCANCCSLCCCWRML